ncbi:uncharacterized protein HaLaN_15324 [Haematococcus lacustris]|uniref:Uncharacterized protein n=1 Tax=Haematococcus lacustris TaxID=44745 RepID=A0A699ZA38_HAELA|nr:uncharacterized protein HaLaN_15324 [Haematococcus lacustris]
MSKIVPDQLQLPSTVEGVQLATAASVTFGQLRAIAASLDSTPLQNCIAAARNYHPDPERQVEKAMVNVGTLLADQGPRQDAGGLSGPDPGVALACDVYNYVKAYHQRTQVMASGLRTREVS